MMKSCNFSMKTIVSDFIVKIMLMAISIRKYSTIKTFSILRQHTFWPTFCFYLNIYVYYYNWTYPKPN